MTVVNLESVRNNYGIRLFKDAVFGGAIELAEFISPTTSVFTAPTLKGIRVESVYELVGGLWVERTDVRISGDNILLDTAPVNQLMIVPKSSLSLIQAGTSLGVAKEIFIKTFAGFITENFTITTYDTETTLPGPFEFALTEAGTYADALGPIDVPVSIWIRSKATVIGGLKTTPIVVTTDIYL